MRYYPVEMIAAMLNSVMDTSEKVAHYIKFAEENGAVCGGAEAPAL